MFGIIVDEKPRTTSRYLSGRATSIVIGICFLTMAGVGIAAALDKYASEQVISTEDAGSIASAAFTWGYWGRTTAIRTEVGTFLVEGVLQALHGHRIRIEGRGNGTKYLCDVETNECRRMIER